MIFIKNLVKIRMREGYVSRETFHGRGDKNICRMLRTDRKERIISYEDICFTQLSHKGFT